MIDLISKLPDSVIGIVTAGAVWFGFNYAVLGERALERYGDAVVLPACIASIEGHEAGIVPPNRPRIGDMLGVPELDVFTDELITALKPRLLSTAEKIARCECAISQVRAPLRFDYAVHTATFRLVAPDRVAGVRRSTIDNVMSGQCGALPNNPYREG